MSTKRDELPIDEIDVDPALQMRGELDEDAIERYTEAYRSDPSVMPPVVVFLWSPDRGYSVVDGFHRIEAAKRAGLASIDCEIHAGGYADALKYALGANRTHGLPRSNADTRKAIQVALTHDATRTLSDRAIASLVGCSPTTVGTVRRQVSNLDTCDNASERIGRDGKVYPATQAKPAVNSLIPPDGCQRLVTGEGWALYIEPCDMSSAEFFVPGAFQRDFGEAGYFVTLLRSVDGEEEFSDVSGLTRGIPASQVSRFTEDLVARYDIKIADGIHKDIEAWEPEPLRFNRFMFASLDESKMHHATSSKSVHVELSSETTENGI